MVSLAGGQLDYCVYQSFDTSQTSFDIHKILEEVMVEAASLDFEVIAIIGDGAQCNRQFQKNNFTLGGKDNLHMAHPVTGEPIYYISDPSHVVKKIVSSLSSNKRYIKKTVLYEKIKVDMTLSLKVMFKLWMSFNDNAGLNMFKSFKTIDFVKNSFQSMRVGPCIKVLGPRMIEMIDLALLYKEEYSKFKDKVENIGKINPYEFYKDAEQYLGWREVCEMFSELFNILNSTENRLNTTSYSHNYQFLIRFNSWFLNWKEECINRVKAELPLNHTSYEAMTGFFTAEASEDCLSMIQGIISLTTYYCNLNNSSGEYFFFLPRRISQDLVENAFARIRVAIGHARLDHITTFNACVEVNMMKEVKTNIRAAKKRNAAGANDDVDDIPLNVVDPNDCIEYAAKYRKQTLEKKGKKYNPSKAFAWKIENGFVKCSNILHDAS